MESRINAIFRVTERIARQIDDVLDFVRIKPLDISKRSVLRMLRSAVQTTPVLENVKSLFPKMTWK
ncbi:MAG: hypothetical protein HZA82_07280 [Thaumarchaeota archaeon]|nr:hypothetical protein [Nitrososphaerota archaeon]